MTKVSYVLLIVTLSLIPLRAGAANAPASSLFFTPEETRAVDAMAAGSEAADGDSVRLDAILYYGRNDWTLWMQNARWTPATRRAGLRVVDVGRDSVRLDIDGVEGEVILKPHQIYRLASGRIDEAR